MHWLKQQFPTRITAWYPAVILATGVLAYANSFACPFLFDDTSIVTNNPHIYHLWPPWRAVLAPTRFLADYSFALNYAWAGFSPAEFRLVNIAIHLGAGLLLYGLMRRTLRLPVWHSRFADSASELALATALLWTLHPIQTESVTYIAQRIEALMGLFFLLTFYAFVRGASAPGSSLWKPAAVAACAFGMATKEVMITAPFLLILYDGLFLSSSWRGILKRWPWHAAFLSTGIIAMALLMASLMRAEAEHVPLVGAGAVRWEYALTQLNVLVHYLKLSVIPHSLCLDYRWPLVQSPLDALWPGSLTVGLGIGTLWAIWKRSWVGFIGAWFFVILAPSSSINPLLDAAFEHRMYLPLAGVMALLVIGVDAGLRRLFSDTRARVIGGLAIGAVAIAVFTGLTHLRNETYLTQERMWRDVMLKRPDNYRTYISLSNALLEEERYQETLIVCSNLLLRLPPFSTLSYDRIQNEYVHPGHPPVHMYYGMALNILGQAAMNLNEPGQAKERYRESIRVFPAGYWAHRNLGHALYLENRVDEAIAEWNTAIEWQPKESQSHGYLGVALSRKHQYREAAEHFEKAVAFQSDFWFARSQWAWLLATCPSNDVRNGSLALTVAQPLLTVAGETSPRALDIVAAAYAEMGDYSNAVKFVRQAIKRAHPLAPHTTQDYTLETLHHRLNQYLEQKPWRE